MYSHAARRPVPLSGLWVSNQISNSGPQRKEGCQDKMDVHCTLYSIADNQRKPLYVGKTGMGKASLLMKDEKDISLSRMESLHAGKAG